MAIDPKIRLIYYVMLDGSGDNAMAILRDGEALRALNKIVMDKDLDVSADSFEATALIVVKALIKDLEGV